MSNAAQRYDALSRELIELGCGQRVGRYTFLRKVATGGMAEVFAARVRGAAGFERKVAIKRILPQYAHNTRFVDMLSDEAKITASLLHPNIAQVYELCTNDGTPFLAMEYVDGPPLSRLIARANEREERVPIELAVHVMCEVAKGLEHAHRQTDERGASLMIVHRDVSPQNVLLSYEGEVKLIDFGIARAEGRAARTGHGVIKGKLKYLAPEIANGEEPDHRADVYCCGLVLFEILTGEPMFAPATDMEAIELAREARVRTPRALNPAVPEALEQIVLRALHRDRTTRYQSARELHAELRAFSSSYAPAFGGAPELTAFVHRLFGTEMEEIRQIDVAAEALALSIEAEGTAGTLVRPPPISPDNLTAPPLRAASSPWNDGGARSSCPPLQVLAGGAITTSLLSQDELMSFLSLEGEVEADGDDPTCSVADMAAFLPTKRSTLRGATEIDDRPPFSMSDRAAITAELPDTVRPDAATAIERQFNTEITELGTDDEIEARSESEPSLDPAPGGPAGWAEGPGPRKAAGFASYGTDLVEVAPAGGETVPPRSETPLPSLGSAVPDFWPAAPATPEADAQEPPLDDATAVRHIDPRLDTRPSEPRVQRPRGTSSLVDLRPRIRFPHVTLILALFAIGGSSIALALSLDRPEVPPVVIAPEPQKPAPVPAPPPPEPEPVVEAPAPVLAEDADEDEDGEVEPPKRRRRLQASLRIRSVPPATIFVDGKRRGTTPRTLALKPGMREIVLEAPNGEKRRVARYVSRGKNQAIVVHW